MMLERRDSGVSAPTTNINSWRRIHRCPPARFRATCSDVPYHYESANAQLLTGVSYDGVRYSNVSYDASGRVQSSGLVGGVEQSTFAYTSSSTAVTNAKGSVSTYNYETVDGNRRLVSVDRPAFDNCPSAVRSVSYDPGSKFATATTDWKGNTTTYSYLAEGLLSSVTLGSPNGADSSSSSYVTYTWDKAINEILEEKHYERGLGGQYYWGLRYSVVNEYFAQTDPEKARIKSSTIVPGVGADPTEIVHRKKEFAYTFHTNGMVATITVTELDGLTRTVEEYSDSGALLSVTNALNQKTTFSNHTALGRPRTIIDLNGNTTSIGYDSRGRRTSITREVGGAQVTTRFTYNGRNQVTSITHPDGHVESFLYDSAGRLTQYDPTNQSDVNIVAKYGYDLLSNVTSETVSGWWIS